MSPDAELRNDKPTEPRPFPWPLVAVLLAITVVVLAVRPRPAAERPAAVTEGGTVHAILFCANATPAERGGIDASKVIDLLEISEFSFDASPVIVVSLTPDRMDRRYRVVVTTQGGTPLSRVDGGDGDYVRRGTERSGNASIQI